jgi:formylglycine-generating enzyme required for sulfatase activity
VREDFLARLFDRAGARLDRAPIVRIGPLAPAGARDAILRPLAARRLVIAPELLDRLLTDLVAAGRQLGAELGWGALEPIYPPHLQLACAVLYDRLPADDATLTLALYQQLGGFDAIVGEHLDRVLDALDVTDGAIARDLFLARWSPWPTVARPAAKPSSPTRSALAPPACPRCSSTCAARAWWSASAAPTATRSGSSSTTAWCPASRPGSIAAISRAAAPSSWSAITCAARSPPPRACCRAPSSASSHPTPTPSPRSTPTGGAPSARPTTPGPHPALVARSRQVQRRVTLAAIGLVLTVIAGVGAAVFERWRSANDRRAEVARRDRDLGLVAFEFAPFDWNVDKLEPIDVPITDLPNLRWAIHTVKLDPDTDVEDPGDPYPAERFRLLSSTALPGGTRLDTAEASGGPAFLVISGRNRAGEPDCGPSIIPIRALPGYPQRKLGPQRHRIPVPSCSAQHSDMLRVSGGPFIFGGVGEPPSPLLAASSAPPETTLDIPTFYIGRTEVTNAMASMYTTTATLTGARRSTYFDSPGLGTAHMPYMPVTFQNWHQARSLCRYWGLRLPTEQEWHKALRGPSLLDGGANRRVFAWSGQWIPGGARIREPEPGASRPCSHPLDVSIYGVCDLVGNVQEWTSSPVAATDGFIVRGASWDSQESSPEGTIVDWVQIPNPRPSDTKRFDLGVRCAEAP